MTLAIDRFRAKALSPADEAAAQEAAAYMTNNANVLLGYLEASIAIDLERPRWRHRRRLAIDLRAVEIARKKR